MNEFLKRLGKDEKTIAYGPEEIEKAAIYGAIENLLLIEDFLRTTDQERRQFLENLLENTEKSGGYVEIVNINSEIGKQIKALGGMIALLRFPI
jgi:protein pelota